MAAGARAESVDSAITIPNDRPNPWVLAEDLYIGDTGTGSMLITLGGVVSNQGGVIGRGQGAVGAVRINGQGSSWSNSGILFIGDNGQGTLDVVSNAVLTSAGAAIGNAAGSTAAVTIDREGVWTNTGNLAVGVAGNGALDITASGQVTSTSGSVGTGGGTGKVFVKGDRSSWTNTGALTIGNGSLAVEGAGRVVSGSGSVGDGAGTEGTVRILDSGSRWTNDEGLIIGRAGTGNLRIEGGGEVRDTNGVVGTEQASSGTVTIAGEGSVWRNSAGLNVGVAGTGAVTLEGGGQAFAGTTSLGQATTGTGTIKVTGQKSRLTGGAVAVGASGRGDVVIEAGGLVSSTSAVIGSNAGGSGSAKIAGDGSVWSNAGALTVGSGGTGTLAVESGGLMATGSAVIGTSTATQSSALVTGAGSKMRNYGDLAIGGTGNGALAVTAGGRTESTTITIGAQATGVGRAEVNGAGSFIVTREDLAVGAGGNGTLAVTAGGRSSSATITIGRDANAQGAAVVAGDGSRLAATGAVRVGGAGQGALTVQAGGVVDAGAIIIAALNGSNGTLNIGSASKAPSEAVAAGALNAGELLFGRGTGTLNLNHSETAYVIDTSISGQGTIDQIAGTTIVRSDSRAFTGRTDVQGGVFRVDGTLGGTVDVRSDARLTGDGTVGTTSVADGGTIAPGNPVGTLNVDGDITLKAGSTYEMAFGTGRRNDQITATGAAFLEGGTLSVIGTPDGFAPLIRVLTAAGGINGAFGLLSSDFTFLEASLQYDANSVSIALKRNNVAFADVAETRNQRATARGLDSLPFGTEVQDAVVMLNGGQARRAFDQLSGEVHASAVTAAYSDALRQRGAVLARLRDLQHGGRGGFTGPLTSAYAASNRGPIVPSPYAPVGEEPAVTAFGGWAQGFGSWGDIASDGNAASLSTRSSGFAAGVDGGDDRWTLGLAGGYTRTDLDVAARSSSGTVEGVFGSLYGGASLGAANLRLGASYSHNAIETDRSVQAGGLRDSLEAGYDGYTAQAFGEIGYGIAFGAGLIEPFVGGAVVRVHNDDFAENGGPAALSGGSRDNDLGVTTLGVRMDWQAALAPVGFKGMLAWQRAYGDVTPSQLLAFRAGSSGFEIGGVPVDRDSLLVEAGLNFQFSDRTVFDISYTGSIGGDGREHGVKGRFATSF